MRSARNFLPHQLPTISSGAPRRFERIGDHTIAAHALHGELGKDVVAAGDADQLADPLDRADHRLVPLLEVDARAARPAARRQRASRRGGARRPRSRPRPRRCGRRDGHQRSVAKISATLRWLVISTFRPARISLSASAACMSEKPITRSGRSSTMRSILAVEKGRDARLLLARAPGAHGVAGDADDARLLARAGRATRWFLR